MDEGLGGPQPERLPTAASREDRDELRKEFGQRLRSLLDVTGLSTREFAQLYPAYKDSTIRKYTLGTNLPPWDFLRDLVTEADRRSTGSGESAETLLNAYRALLVRLGAVVTGSDQNSLLLRLLDGEAALQRQQTLISDLTARELHLAAEIERLSSAHRPRSVEPDRLREELAQVAGRKELLVRQRMELVGDLDRTRALLVLLQDGDGDAQDQLPPAGGGPSHPAVPPTGRGQRRLLAVAAAVVLVAAAFAFGAWFREDDPGETAAPSQGGTPARTAPTASAVPAASSSAPSDSGSSASPSSSSPPVSGSAAPDTELSEPVRHKIDLPDGYGIDFSSEEPKIVVGYADLGYDTWVGAEIDAGSKRPLVLLGDRQEGSLQVCLQETRYSPNGIDESDLSEGSQVCAVTDKGHVILATVRSMPDYEAPSRYFGLDVTVWRFAAAPSEETP